MLDSVWITKNDIFFNEITSNTLLFHIDFKKLKIIIIIAKEIASNLYD